MARRPKKSEELAEEAASVEVLAGDSVPEGSSTDESDAQSVKCGAALQAARNAQGLTTQDVAKQLRLSGTQVDALEEDRFSDLPEATIVKGFIRNYAKLLKISAEPLLNAYAQLAPAKQDYSFALNPGINMKITEGRKSHKLGYFLAAIAILLAVGIWFFYQSYVQKPNPINPMPEISDALPELVLPMSEQIEDTSVTQIEMPAQTLEPSLEAENTIATEKTVEQAEVATEKDKSQPETETAETEVAETEVDETEVAATEVAATEPPPVAGKVRLAFSATQETWLSVVNTSGKEVYNKILYAGDRDVVDIRQPAEIVVGNAHGATLVVNGKPIDLAPYTRINVARVRMNRLR